MKHFLVVSIVCLLLSGCSAGVAADLPDPQPAQDHHPSVSGTNILPHDPVGYCGNTTTTVTFPYAGTEEWNCCFWGGQSVALTDLLRWLDYSQPICRCLPEYRVDTEFGSSYGISLSQRYVRHGEGQASLTDEQAVLLTQLLQYAASQADTDGNLCCYPTKDHFTGALF